MYGEDYESMGPAPNLAAGEHILWRGKPKKSAYIADKALSMLPIAVIWLIFDFNFIFLFFRMLLLKTFGFYLFIGITFPFL